MRTRNARSALEWMELRFSGPRLTRIALAVVLSLALSLVVILPGFAQKVPSAQEAQDTAAQEQYQIKLQQVRQNRAGYASAIVARWEGEARAIGKWDANYTRDLFVALMKLGSENLLAAGEATSYDAMAAVLMQGSRAQAPQTLGDFGDDLVYTPVAPCRIVDTRNIGSPILANTTMNFDVDGGTFVGQGGNAGPCGIPFNVAAAVAMNITATGPTGPGFFTAWAVLSPQPGASILNFVAGDTIANSSIVPVLPGPGNDFSVYSGVSTSHLVVDVLGYFAAPVATALDCITLSSAVTAVPDNVWTPVDADCPADRTATGGGYDTPEGTLGYPGVWVTTLPNGNGWRTWVDNQTGGLRSIQTFVRCCRVPGR